MMADPAHDGKRHSHRLDCGGEPLIENPYMPRLTRLLLLSPLLIFLCQCTSGGDEWEYGFVPGKTAIIIKGKAVPPADAPEAVLRAISAGNRICSKPYRRGGGHAKFEDSAYDCSGAVSYILHAANKLDSTAPSGHFRKYGKSGEGDWITVYAKNGHVFAVVAGLRFDTGYSDRDSRGPRWTDRSRPIKGFTARHPSGL